MAGTCLIRCVLIQVLLTTVYGDLQINCSNQTGTVGEPLLLNCTVPCDGCKIRDYKWSKEDNPDGKNCRDGEKHEIPIGKNYMFQCKIPSASLKHNGTFTFWVQTNKGNNRVKFNVTIVPNAPVPTVIAYQQHTPVATEKTNDENDHSYKVAVAVVAAVISCLVIVIMAAGFLRRKKKENLSALFTRTSNAETEIPVI